MHRQSHSARQDAGKEEVGRGKPQSLLRGLSGKRKWCVLFYKKFTQNELVDWVRVGQDMGKEEDLGLLSLTSVYQYQRGIDRELQVLQAKPSRSPFQRKCRKTPKGQ